MKTLAIDTSAHLCAVCIHDTDTNTILAQESHDIGRGHAEVLMKLVETCFHQAGLDYSDLHAIGVTIGPGSFTGVRVGMSVARGLALSLDLPVAGVSTLDACEALGKKLGSGENAISLLDAKRGELYCKFFNQPAFVETYEGLFERIKDTNPSLCGSGAAILNDHFSTNYPIIHTQAAPQISLVAEIAASSEISKTPPEPLYLRSADAKVQAGFALERI